MALLLALAAGAAAQDPAVARPGNYQVEIDNPWVRVLRVKQAPGEKSPLHQHPASVVVFLTEVRLNVAAPDGTTRELARKAGDVAYFDAERHTEENLAAAPLEMIVVELKPGAPKGPPSAITLDPVQVDPRRHTVPIENHRVRVLRTVIEPRLRGPMHEHPHYVVVYLTELHTTMTFADGKTVDNPRRPGEVAWRDALRHQTVNVGENTAAEIQIELK
jgi:quercetin dioxygenase-like cupin family protein